VPQQTGDRVKTDRRDASKLARYLRSGDLTAVYVPDEIDEAMRDLVRARSDAKKALHTSRQQLNHFFLRHDRRFDGKSRWTKAHFEWLRKQHFEHPAQECVLADYLRAVETAGERGSESDGRADRRGSSRRRARGPPRFSSACDEECSQLRPETEEEFNQDPLGDLEPL